MTAANRLADALEEALGRGGARAAVICEDDPQRSVSCSGLLAMAAELRSSAREAGAGPGSVVPIVAERSPECVAAMLAVARHGGAFACVNPRLKAPQLDPIVADCRPRGLLVDAAGARAAADVAMGRATSLVPIARGAAGVLNDGATGSAPAAPGAGAVLFTSGSTGRAKGVVIGADDLVSRARTEIDCYGLTAADHVLCVLPFSFDVGLNQLWAALLSGATLHLSDRWLRRDLLKIFSRSAVTGVSGVPWLFAQAMGGLAAGERVFGATPALRYVAVSGGSLRPPQFAELVERLDPHVRAHRTYGQTETFRSAIFRDAGAAEHAARAHCVGRPVPGTRIWVARDRQHLALAGEEGELLHAGAGTMLGYLGDEVLTRAKLGAHAELPGAQVVYTGDRARIDADGYISLLGRADGMIKTAGNRVYPAEVEALLASHPAVAEVVVVGVDDARLEQRVAAAVVPKGPLDVAGLRKFAAERMPGYMVPSPLRVLEALPRTETGKPALAELRALLTRRDDDEGR